MKLTLSIFIWVATVYTVFAQSPYAQADEEFNSLSYLKASQLFEKILKEDDLKGMVKLSAQAKLAYSYRQLKDTESAERVFREMISEYGKDLPEDYVKCYLYYAQALASNGNYQEAQETFTKYNSLQQEGDKRGGAFSKLYNNVAILTKNAGSYKVEYLTINSSEADFSPTYYKGGLVFVSGRNEVFSIKRVFNWDQSAFLDLYWLDNLKKIKGKSTSSSLGGSITPSASKESRRKRSMLGLDAYTPLTPNDSRIVGFYAGSAYNSSLGYDERPLTETERLNNAINTKYHEGPATFFADGNRVIFTRSNYNKGTYGVSKEGINKLKLYSAEMINGKWGDASELPLNSNEYSTGHPAINPDNTLLYFVSDRPGGYGGTDIYVSQLNGDTWSEPLNLGPQVNTAGNEMFPFVDERNNLYFASDGHPGMGGLDIFYAPMASFDQPLKSINLGAPINSSKDDFGVLTDGERSVGYFSSNRKEGGKDDDIYRFRREGPLYACRDLTVMVYDEATNEPLRNALVQLENKNLPQDVRQLRTDSTGNLLLCLAAENEFVFIASSEGYFNNTIGLRTEAYTDDRPSMVEIPLKRAEIKQAPLLVTTAYNANGKILSHKGNKPISGVKVTIKDEVDGSIQEVITDEDGSYSFQGTTGHNYRLDAQLDKFGTFGKQIIGFDSTKIADLTFLMFERGDVVNIENIYYDLDKYEIRADAALELNKVVSLLEKYPEMRIELGSHTDSRASSRYNKLLSINRAKSAKFYLLSKGIDTGRITTKGYGESDLVNDCTDRNTCTEEQHQKNRRTEIRILNLQ